ncbi:MULTISPECIES: hypothetical protein [unclassified Streptomyces]|uniref:hypothetical protein n=1 Tax=unclassified Streptomyces TaxID=2593676 RepID=UPI00331B0FC5
MVRTASAGRPTEADTRSEESEDDWRQSLEAALTPIASMVASILSLAAGEEGRKA